MKNKVKKYIPPVFVSVKKIKPDPDQPREYFDEEKLEELRISIKENGLLNAIHVKPAPDHATSGEYLIVGGERRWKCFIKLGIDEIPAIILSANTDSFVWALVDNMNRADMNPMEEAKGFNVLYKKRGMSQQDIANRVGKSQKFVSSRLALLKLPGKLQTSVAKGRLKPTVAGIMVQRCYNKSEMSDVAAKLTAAGRSSNITMTALNNYLDMRDAEQANASRKRGESVKLPKGRRSTSVAPSGVQWDLYKELHKPGNLLTLIFERFMRLEENNDQNTIEKYIDMWEKMTNKERDTILNEFRTIRSGIKTFLEWLEIESEQ